ncbi:formin-like protein 7 [Impatiens glandulifera]|uniref:formin-like protein 7 n=1 Tax=Impatiens glandulifera TaxID=253017 RepID=UPI001FB04F8F|nr:formin-like protein 7 [Impatiens glandulifera]
MASGSSARNNPGSKGFDFASDDILCSYDDYNHDASNGTHSEQPIGTNSAKEFHKSRMARSSMFPAPAYSPPDESFNHEVISVVEKTMKKHSDNLMRFLEGLSSRLSQLELYCYNLDKSISEMRSDLNRDHGEQDSKLKSLEKHLQEVHRSVQILRDKQELAETQKELAKLQHAQKESTSTSHSHQIEERAAAPSSEAKKPEGPSDVHQGQQLALALPHQVSPITRPVEQQQPIAPPQPQPLPQSQAYYLPPAGLQNPPALPHQSPSPQYLQPDSQYRTSHLQDMSRPGAQPVQNHGNQAPPLPQYQQQWPQQQPSVSSQNRVPPGSVYPPYLPGQPANIPPPPPSQESIPNNMGMQGAYTGIPQQGGFGGGPGRTMQSQPQQMKANYGVQTNDGYNNTPQFTQGNAYMMYDAEGNNRAHHQNQPPPPQFSQGSYPPSSPLQNPQSMANTVNRPQPPNQSPFMRNNNNNNNTYGELIEKLVTMGYRGDHVTGVIQRLEESGQPIDFNAVLDRLNGHPSSSGSGSQRGGWSG